MSILLDKITALAVDTLPAITALSPESVCVLLFAQQLLSNPRNWLDTAEDPADRITPADWVQIQQITSEVYYQIMRPLLGIPFPYITADPPPGTLPCDGSSHLRVDYPQLYELLDSAFIVDADTFITPDLRGRTLIGSSATYPVGSTGGSSTHTLTVPEMPSHTHSYAHPDIPTLVFEPGEVPVATIDLIPDVTGSTGGDQPHNNMQPYLALKYCIHAA